ncbi:hypothetical protein Peur_003233 [Populus x canadensis]
MAEIHFGTGTASNFTAVNHLIAGAIGPAPTATGIRYDGVAWSLLLGLVLLANGLIELLQVCPSLICFAPDIVYGVVRVVVNLAICNGNQVEHHRPPELNYFFGSRWPWSRFLAQCCCIIKLQGFNFLKWILVPIKSSGAEGFD